MATLNISRLPVSTVSPTSYSSTPTISAYNTWYSCGRCEWTAQVDDILTIQQWVVTSISAVTSSGSDQLAVYFRQRLYDATLGRDVPAGIRTSQVFRTVGATEYGIQKEVTNFSTTFLTGMRGILTPGHEYECHIETKKEQAVGTPTLTLTIIDSTTFADAGTIR